VLAAIAPGIATLGAGLLAPGLVALKLDQEPGRPMARTVLTCGLAGCVQPVITLWNTGQSFGAAVARAARLRAARGRIVEAWGLDDKAPDHPPGR
jgi:hypothetical protein